ncbi:hypothetical protein [Mycobacterium avium]|uniref:hypothetical protein n=2 Tax=Mycobacterium avium TaxID=1764 RepID=UPI002939A619|nr:hypothetical protein [Mycobacterium avium]MDV3292334.1 hypothetical protein [Mycobacterium avium subsp. hominissuis]MDV3301830.1 hypothetical protein [Mycobacterium avium]MDV3306661.1 hypothetical protein [Mycobacterium avium subsp. hominissuis]MDV3324101.1 hypothetical protein [Mycobacterium avium subsp. hominissuis]
MASVAGSGSNGDFPAWWVERNNQQAERLLKTVTRARNGTIQPPSLPHASGDHPRPQGAFVRFLFQPYVWPEDSETALNDAADKFADEFKLHDDSAMTIRQAVHGVFDGGSWVGESADAARAAQLDAATIKDRQAEIARVASGLIRRGADDVASTKKHMFEQNTQAHQEAEKFLKSRSGQSLAQVAVILGVHRTAIEAYSTELQGFSTQYTTQFTNHIFKEGGPSGGRQVREAGNGTKPDQSTGDETPPGPPDPTLTSTGTGNGPRPAASTPGPGSPGPPALGGPRPAQSTEGVPRPSHNPLTSLLNGGLPSLPSMPGGGGGLPMLQGLMGGFGGLPAGMAPPTGLSAPGLQGSPMPSLGMDFGRGLAAGASAAGAVPPVTQAPMTPLAAPIESAPTSAAPAAAPVAATPPAAASAPAPAPAAGVPAGGLTSYGSVLPPQATSPAPPVGSAPATPSIPAEAGGAAAGAGAGTGLMPVAGRRDVVVRKNDAYSDLETAKDLVAELAGAAKVTDPGLDWAVAVGRNASGMPTYWVATNDGATYIPPQVFLRKTMPIAGGHDADFDARWFGWVNPADKAARAAREFGDTVSAVATSWALPSEYLAEHPSPPPPVATGVKPRLEPDNMAADPSAASRAHRLQTVDAALYADLAAADESVVRDYCRELIRQLVFGIPGEDLSPVAQAVGHALVAERWPSDQEWAALGEEHQDALVQMACQRPGLDGLENPDQTVSYTREFVRCRQLEALLCWERHGGDLLNVVYAAWVAGIRAPLKGAALR